MSSIITEKSYVDSQIEFDFRKWKSRKTVEWDKMHEICEEIYYWYDMQIGYSSYNQCTQAPKWYVLWSPKPKNRPMKYGEMEVIERDWKITNSFFHHMRNHIMQNIYRRKHSTPKWEKYYPELSKLSVI